MNIQEHGANEVDDLRIAFRDFLNEEDMTLIKASSLINCSVGTVSLFLNGKTTPHQRTLYKIRKLIGDLN